MASRVPSEVTPSRSTAPAISVDRAIAVLMPIVDDIVLLHRSSAKLPVPIRILDPTQGGSPIL